MGILSGLRCSFLQATSGVCMQALWQVFAARPSSVPAAAAAGCASALFLARRLGRLPAALEPLSRNLLGWTATLLFMFQPLAQLVRGPGFGLCTSYLECPLHNVFGDYKASGLHALVDAAMHW